MIILGNKYQITKEEEKELLTKVKNIHYLDIKNEKETIKKLKEYIQNNDIEFIVLNLDKKLSLELKGYLEELDYDGIKILIFNDFVKKFLDREIIEFNEKNLKVYNTIHNDNFKCLKKRIFDIIFSSVVLVCLSPIFLIIAVLIKIKSPNGPIFFMQQRVGKNGKFFRVIKFRTMVPDAEKVLQEMLEKDEQIRKAYLKYRKLKDDPRVIKGIGKFLRETSLDELPQFFNILIGDMSVVGPRPYIKDEFYNHDEKFLNVITSIKPGITGLWQVEDRNETDFHGRVLKDIEYILKQNFWLDIKIIFKTIKVMILRKGAY